MNDTVWHKPTPLDSSVRIQNLSVRYSRDVLALDSVHLTLRPGLVGLLGPNGAGKTTLMRTLATLQEPTSGTARIFGLDLRKDAGAIRELLGFLPQDFQTYPQLRCWEVLDYYAILNRLSERPRRHARVGEVLELVGLAEVADRKAGQLSGGMLRRLGVAQALLNDPKLLILDEPTAGLDPAERIRFRTFIAELSRGRTILLSTHIVSDIGSSCDRLAVIEKGQVRFEGSRASLLQQADGCVWRGKVLDAGYQAIRRRYTISSMVETADAMELKVVSSAPPAPDWSSVEPSLEDAYLWLLQGAAPKSSPTPAIAPLA